MRLNSARFYTEWAPRRANQRRAPAGGERKATPRAPEIPPLTRLWAPAPGGRPSGGASSPARGARASSSFLPLLLPRRRRRPRPRISGPRSPSSRRWHPLSSRRPKNHRGLSSTRKRCRPSALRCRPRPRPRSGRLFPFLFRTAPIRRFRPFLDLSRGRSCPRGLLGRRGRRWRGARRGWTLEVGRRKVLK